MRSCVPACACALCTPASVCSCVRACVCACACACMRVNERKGSCSLTFSPPAPSRCAGPGHSACAVVHGPELRPPHHGARAASGGRSRVAAYYTLCAPRSSRLGPRSCVVARVVRVRAPAAAQSGDASNHTDPPRGAPCSVCGCLSLTGIGWVCRGQAHTTHNTQMERL